MTGFVERRDGARTLLARPEILESLLARGLGSPSAWDAMLGAGGGSPGRGSTARIELDGGSRLILKKMRRGGLAGAWRADRFGGSRRLLDNLAVPVEVARRGVPTAAPAALLLEEGPPGLYQGWLATDEIAGAVDLLTRLAKTPAPSRDVLAAAAALVRRAHDAGVEHRDLNLGNLLVREEPELEAFLVDLDGARLHPGPLSTAMRRDAVRRIARSHEKRFGRSGPDWAELYAGGDAELLRGLRRNDALGRLSLAMHRTAWRMKG